MEMKTPDRQHSKKRARPPSDDKEQAEYQSWKSNIPLLYDLFENHNLDWPAYSCCWGEPIKHSEHYDVHRFFLSRATDAEFNESAMSWPGHPHALLVCSVKLARLRRANDHRIASFHEESPSPNIAIDKRIIHPGSINRIKSNPELPNMVATQSESRYVYIWDTKTQKDRQLTEDGQPSKADIVLKGHTDKASYALDFGPSNMIVSGGADKKVCVWSIDDYTATVASSRGSLRDKLSARNIFTEHEGTVEDCAYHPSNPQRLCSVGNDRLLLMWDCRVAKGSTQKIRGLHSGDINCVSWNKIDDNLILTGSSDHTVQLLDLRKPKHSYHTFIYHKNYVTNVQWHPSSVQYFASSSEDGLIIIWDTSKIGTRGLDWEDDGAGPPELMFRHAGHRTSIPNFDWNTRGTDQWTIATLSDDSGRDFGGGTLQIWRPSDLIYRPRNEVVKELTNLECVKRFVF